MRMRLIFGFVGTVLVFAAIGAVFWLSGRPAVAPNSHAPEPSGPPWFQDITEAAGLDFTHDPGPVGTFFMPQAIGSGAVVFDFDGDGLLDIYLLQNGGPKGAKNRLFRQLPGFRFQDVSAGSGLDIAGYNMGAVAGDINNDGHLDVIVTQFGGIRLFLGQGNGKFADATDGAGLQNPNWGASAALLDYDRDGLLDLVVVNYVDYDPTWPCTTTSGKPEYCAPKTFAGRATRLFHNLGNGRFEDVTVASGLGKLAGPGLGVLCADFDGDGWIDIFVANDGEANRLWINRHNGTFADEATLRGVAYNAMSRTEAGMGIALGDVNGDGLPDLLVTHLTEETHTLWQQGPRGFFTDRTAAVGLSTPRWRGTGFGVVLEDFDLDGALDAAVANGRIAAAAQNANSALGPHWGLYAERNQLFANDGKGRFRDISPDNADFCGAPNVARGLISADFDNDGAPDLLVTMAGGRARLFRNVAPRDGRWLHVRAIDPALKRDAIGAEIRVRAAERTWQRTIVAGDSFLCCRDARAHFGLGPVESVDAINVTWPDAVQESFPPGATNRSVTLRKGTGTTVAAKEKKP